MSDSQGPRIEARKLRDYLEPIEAQRCEWQDPCQHLIDSRDLPVNCGRLRICCLLLRFEMLLPEYFFLLLQQTGLLTRPLLGRPALCRLLALPLRTTPTSRHSRHSPVLWVRTATA